MAQQQRAQKDPPKPAAPTAVDLYKPQPVKTVAGLLEGQLHKLAAVIPSQIDSRRFARLAISMLNKRNELANCTARSLLLSIMEAAQLGLELDPTLGHAYLVPFRAGQQTLAQLIVGYRGYIHLLRLSGRLRGKPYARPVYEGDTFDLVQGTEERVHHVPVAPAQRKIVDGNPVLLGFYAVIHFVDGFVASEWMWKYEIDAIRARSRAGESGPWVTDYEEMAKKTVLRRICKTSDASPEVTRVAAAEEAREAGLDVSLTEFTEAELVGLKTVDTTKKLEEKYRGQQGSGAEPDTAKDTASGKAGKGQIGCDAKHADPTVFCDLEKGHRGSHQWAGRRDERDPGEPTAEELDAAGVGREPGGEG